MSDVSDQRRYYERMLDEIATEHRQQIDHLEFENAKLRKELAMRSQSEQEKVIEYLRNENVDWEDRYRALAAKNARLRKACADLLHMAESHDPEWLHWPEMHDELRKMGVEA